MKPEEIFVNYLVNHGIPIGARVPIPEFCPDIVVVIPCYDEDHLPGTLSSLLESYRFSPVRVLVIVVVNAAENSPESVKKQNVKTIDEIQYFKQKIKEEKYFKTEVINVDDMPVKDAGVGLARKIGMDEAVRIFLSRESDGIIACLDADSLCSSDYLIQLKNAFREAPSWDAACIHFEHPLEGYPEEVIEAIVQYELHLRVFIGFQKWTGLPFAMQTIGSSMAVRAVSYCKYGGMNKRKAGEDFYFLHKIGDKGNVGCIFSTMVIPSPRISGRVPFGTGKAVGDSVRHHKDIKTYNPSCFADLKAFLVQLPDIYANGWHEKLATKGPFVYTFLNRFDAEKHVGECRLHTRDYKGFVKRFYQWFNAFRLMKYCHYCRDEAGYPDVEPMDAFRQLMARTGHDPLQYMSMDAKQALLTMRTMDKNDNL